MARQLGAVCRICRREGIKLFLKGERCHTPKCALQRRPYPPGMHRWRRGKRSEYSMQLREKQKLKRFYGILEAQFRRYFAEAERRGGSTGENMMQLCELRLDNVLTRLGFAPSRAAARQLITHGHVCVNGRKVDIPSYVCKPGEVITPREKEASSNLLKKALETTNFNTVPAWLEIDQTQPAGKVLSAPSIDEVSVEVDTQSIIELLSK